jgi:presenilin-like A22 family membrane protease
MFTVLAYVVPVVVFFVTLLVVSLLNHTPDSWGFGTLAKTIIALGVSSLTGLLFGLIAFVREEARSAWALLAVFINGALLVGLLVLFRS